MPLPRTAFSTVALIDPSSANNDRDDGRKVAPISSHERGNPITKNVITGSEKFQKQNAAKPLDSDRFELNA